MNFKQYLVEFSKNFTNESDIVYQKLLDNLDNGHIDFNSNGVDINVGAIIKDSKYNTLYIHIFKDKTPDVSLSTDNSDDPDDPAIIITTTRLPNRKNIHKFLESEKYSGKIKKCLNRFLHKHFNPEDEIESNSRHEKAKGFNKNFEKHYQELITSVQEKIDETLKAHRFLDYTHKKSINLNKSHHARLGMESLLKDELGSSFNEFKKIITKMPEAEFINHLEGELKKKTLSRLESFYETKIHHLHKKNENESESEEEVD